MQIPHSILVEDEEVGAEEPVSLAEAKAWLEIDYADKDTLLTGMVNGARLSVENRLNLHLVEKMVRYEMETTCAEVVLLPYTKTAAYLSVKSLDSIDVETTLTSGTDYFLRTSGLRLPSAGRYVISYKSVPVITEDIKEAIKMEVAERFANRGENTGELSKSALNKIQPHVVEWL